MVTKEVIYNNMFDIFKILPVWIIYLECEVFLMILIVILAFKGIFRIIKTKLW
jgi:hypothetical protein